MVSIEFEFTKDGMTFKDAIVLEDNHTLSEQDIDAMKQKRFDDWYAVVTAPQEQTQE
jgi:hypothetical protein